MARPRTICGVLVLALTVLGSPLKDLGVVTTLAFAFDQQCCRDGIGTNARISNPGPPIAIDADTLLIPESGAFSIRQVKIGTGVTSTRFGTTTGGLVDAVGTNAKMGFPQGMTRTDNPDIVFVAEGGTCVIRRLTLSTNQVTTVFGGSGPLCQFREGVGISAGFVDPTEIVFGNNRLYITEKQLHIIRQVDLATGQVSRISGNGNIGSADGVGFAATFNFPQGLAFISPNRLFICDQENHRIRLLRTDTIAVTTFVGDGTPVSVDGVGSNVRINKPLRMSRSPDQRFVYVGGQAQVIQAINVVTGDSVRFAGSGAEGRADGVGPAASFVLPSPGEVANGRLFVSDSFFGGLRSVLLPTPAPTSAPTRAPTRAPTSAPTPAPTPVFTDPAIQVASTCGGASAPVADGTQVVCGGLAVPPVFVRDSTQIANVTELEPEDAVSVIVSIAVVNVTTGTEVVLEGLPPGQEVVFTLDLSPVVTRTVVLVDTKDGRPPEARIGAPTVPADLCDPSRRQTLQCAFIEDGVRWSTAGCITDVNLTSDTAKCVCNHATEFALIVREETDPLDPVCDLPKERVLFGALALAYALVFGADMVQLARLRCRRGEKANVVWQHLGVALLCVGRVTILLLRTGVFPTATASALVLLSAIPFSVESLLFFDLAYSFLKAGLMTRKSPIALERCAPVCVAVFLVPAVGLPVVVFELRGPKQVALATISSLIMAGLVGVFCICIMASGVFVLRQLAKGVGKQPRPTDSGSTVPGSSSQSTYPPGTQALRHGDTFSSECDSNPATATPLTDSFHSPLRSVTNVSTPSRSATNVSRPTTAIVRKKRTAHDAKAELSRRLLAATLVLSASLLLQSLCWVVVIRQPLLASLGPGGALAVDVLFYSLGVVNAVTLLALRCNAVSQQAASQRKATKRDGAGGSAASMSKTKNTRKHVAASRDGVEMGPVSEAAAPSPAALKPPRAKATVLALPEACRDSELWQPASEPLGDPEASAALPPLPPRNFAPPSPRAHQRPPPPPRDHHPSSPRDNQPPSAPISPRRAVEAVAAPPPRAASPPPRSSPSVPSSPRAARGPREVQSEFETMVGVLKRNRNDSPKDAF